MSQKEAGDFNPKHRLVGAIVLVAAGVVLLPMILNKEEAAGDKPLHGTQVARETRVVVAEIAPAGQAPTEGQKEQTQSTVTMSSPPDPGTTPDRNALIAPSAVQPAIPSSGIASQEAVTQPVKEKQPPESVPTAKPDQAATKPKLRAAAHGWYVQVGTFSNGDNARQLAGKLRAKGYAVRVEEARLSQGKVMRVRVGPYAQETQAKRAQSEIHKAVAIKGILRRD